MSNAYEISNVILDIDEDIKAAINVGHAAQTAYLNGHDANVMAGCIYSMRLILEQVLIKYVEPIKAAVDE